MQRLSTIADDALLERLHVLVGSHRRVTADLIAHLSEVDARRLHVGRGFSSLFGYCVECLGFSEDEACRRIDAARLVRKFPEIYSLLEGGSVSLTVLGLLKQHLTAENHRELLAAVSRSSVRQAKEWLAARFPQPDVPSSIRKLPERCAVSEQVPKAACAVSEQVTKGASAVAVMMEPRWGDGATRCPTDTDQTGDAPTSVSARSGTPQSGPVSATPSQLGGAGIPQTFDEVRQASAQGDSGTAPLQAGGAGSGTVPPPPGGARSGTALSARGGTVPPAPPRVKIEPLSRDRFLVKFTASRAMKEKLALACDLLRHANPTGDVAVVLERAVDLLVAQLEKTRQGRAKRPQNGRPIRNGASVGHEVRPPKQQAPAVCHEDGATKIRANRAPIPRAIRRQVVERDGWRCSFVAEDGRRCDARAFVEFDHETPKGLGGTSQPENLRLLCRAHNRLAAERIYGKAHISRAIETAQATRGAQAR